MENITNPESIYRCRTVGQMSTIHRLFPKDDLGKRVNKADTSVCSQWIPSVSIVLLKFTSQMLINKAFRKHRKLYSAQLQTQPCLCSPSTQCADFHQCVRPQATTLPFYK